MTAHERIEAAIAARPQATPGPWKAELCLGGSYVIDNTLPENGGKVRRIAEVYGHLSTPSDARLIAAAPDLVDEVVKLRKIIATLSRRANKLERDGVVRMTAEERGKWLDKQCEELEKRDENIAEGYGLERKWFAEAQNVRLILATCKKT